MKRRILIIGCTRVDLGMTVPSLAGEDQTVYGDFPCQTEPGGSACYGAVAVTRLGGEAIICSAVGDDEYGQSMLKFYNDLGMDTRFVATAAGATTSVSFTARSEDGNSGYITTALAKNITPDLVEEAFTSLPDAVYLSLDIPAESAARAAELAREKKIPIFADGELMADDFPIETVGVCDVTALAPENCRHYTGIEPKNAQSNLEAAVQLSKTVKSKTYMFKFGVGGAFIYKGNFSYYVPYIEDADGRFNQLFVPAMILEYLRSAKSVRSARYASTVIALAAGRKLAPIASVPTETEVLRYILEYEVEL